MRRKGKGNYTRGGQKLVVTSEEDEGETVARAHLEVTPADNGQQVTCQVTNPATTTPMVAHTTISVLFWAWEVTGWASPGSVEAGEKTTLICETSPSRPPSTITWSLASTPHHSQQQQGSLSLHNNLPKFYTVLRHLRRSELSVRAGVSDHGQIYTCVAENGLGIAVSTNITLDVLHGPVWVWVPKPQVDVEEGDDLIVTAMATANPGPVRYTWWRGPAAIAGEESEDGSGMLVLPRVHRNLSGNYTVIAAAGTSHPAVNSSFAINVQYGPEDMTAKERVEVDEDGSTTVTCSAAGNPTPNITWTSHTHSNNSIERVLALGVGEARLVVEWVTREDTGLYLCQASNTVSIAPPISTAIVVTQAPTLAGISTLAWEDGAGISGGGWRAATGEVGWLDCRVRAAPMPTFTWTAHHHYRELNDTKKYFIHVPQLVDKVMEWSSVLEIRNVSVLDYINYTCIADNRLGTLTSMYGLTPPIRPATPLYFNVTSVADNTALLKWKINPHGALPTGFTVKYQEAGAPDDDHQLVDVRGGNRTNVTLTHLVAGGRYSFYVLAYNDRGYSNFTSQAITITLIDLNEKVASSSSSGGSGEDLPRVPRLILLLTSLTGTALLVLNISIVVCFLRRRTMRRNMSVSSSKTTAIDVYTPTTASAFQGDELPLATISDAPPPEYQSIDGKSHLEDCDQTSLMTSSENSESLDQVPTPPAPPSRPRSGTASPLLNGGLGVQGERPGHDKNLFPPDPSITLLSKPGHDTSTYPLDTSVTVLPLEGHDNTAAFPPDTSITVLPSGSPRQVEVRLVTESDAASGHTSRNPDVCPVMPSSISAHMSSSRPEEPTHRPYIDHHNPDTSSSDESSDSYAPSPKHLSSYHSSYQPAAAKPTTQVIYHGQPHIQKQMEKQQEQEKLQQQYYQYCRDHGQSPGLGHQFRQATTLHPNFSPHQQLSTSTSSCCEPNYRQTYTPDVPTRYATLQPPRRSCLKPTQSSLQRSYSDHSYSSNSLQCVYHQPCLESQTEACCQSNLCSDSYLNHPHAPPVTERPHEYPVYYAPRFRTYDGSVGIGGGSGEGWARHNSISGRIGYRAGPLYPDSPGHGASSSRYAVTPDLCKVDSTGSTKRVGWKDVLHESPVRSNVTSTDTSTASSTNSTVTLGPSTTNTTNNRLPNSDGYTRDDHHM
ncbi:hypothetical protein Pcinc_015507 [Petrolisthes cinctipes]|uniref:Nephrin n=1 Tax=Petrolisthes cinctipes TaxID=88211 RepID=A0AAE1KQE1_PETCI|nr:hypothetical protein Pcinc_015507 [Petrolisthes cinctipes]